MKCKSLHSGFLHRVPNFLETGLHVALNCRRNFERKTLKLAADFHYAYENLILPDLDMTQMTLKTSAGLEPTDLKTALAARLSILRSRFLTPSRHTG